MKTIYKTGCFIFVILTQWCYAGNFTLPEYSKIELNNGLTLVLMEQHEVPLIDVQVRVKSGAIHGDIIGLADVTAESLRFGAGNRSKEQLDFDFDFIGANLNTWADKEQSGLTASFAKKDQKIMLGIIHDILIAPQFDSKELDKYMTRYATQIEQRQESPKAVIGDYFDALVYPNHPYAHSIMASKQSLKKINRDAIVQFHRTHFRPDNTVLVIAGDFKPSDMKKQIEQLFGSWKSSGTMKSIQLPEIKSPLSSKVMLVDKPDAIETTFYIGGQGITRNNPDFVAISVINTILGGRFTSWLNDELRVNSGLTYGARSQFESYKSSGSFYISTFTKKSTTKEAIDLALSTYQKLWSKGIDEETLKSAKAYVKGQFPPRYETSGQLAGLLADMQVYGFDESYINNFSANVDQLTPAKTKHIIDTYFPKNNLQFVLIGNAEEIRNIAKTYGEVIEKKIKQ